MYTVTMAANQVFVGLTLVAVYILESLFRKKVRFYSQHTHG